MSEKERETKREREDDIQGQTRDRRRGGRKKEEGEGGPKKVGGERKKKKKKWLEMKEG